jgi:hypothetical protein
MTVVAAACGGGGTTPTQNVTRADLLALARDTTAEPNGALCTFKNNQLFHCQITHSDSVGTTFATLTFFPHSIVSRNDTILCDTCTIVITATVSPQTYQFTLGPASLIFNQQGEPTADVSFGAYGDPSVYTQSPKYGTAPEFLQALDLWHEQSPDRWVVGRNSTHSAPTTVSSALEGPGTYLLAAPK